MSNSRSLSVAVCAIGLLSAIAVACFSDRSTTAAGAEDAACQLPSGPEVDGSTVVVIRGYAFHPASVRIRRGTRVTWLNCESTAGLSHTSTASSAQWSSGLITPGAVYTTTFDDAGTFDYHCEPHPFMTGAVVVE